MARADFITHTSKKTENYSDCAFDFSRSPVTGSLARVTNERAVAQSIKTLVQTTYGERLYEPKTGSSVRSLLFDPIDDRTADAIRHLIEETLTNSEPRATCTVRVQEMQGEDGYTVSVFYALINNPGETLQLDFFLERTR